ncbi:MAG: DNA polymerase III subunit delta' [Acidobacteria bacterium]|nr:DNA polymerase III subunit delta' [Acidobacteriota bacterium]
MIRFASVRAVPFRDLIGHRQIVALLARAVAHGSLPQSLVFAGPSGTGKRLAAIATAQAANCGGARAASALAVDACGICPACVRIARGVHPDVPILAPGDAGHIRIDDVRDAIGRAAYRPFEGRRRVVIIDEADALVDAAQNALLKTLEEPPPSSTFILVTARPDLLLPTVRSRCQRLRFGPLGAEDIAAALMARGVAEPEARVLADAAEGSLGRALAASAGELGEARRVAQRVLERSAAASEPARRIDAAKDLLARTGAGGAGDREQLAAHLRAMASLLRDIVLLATRADARALANPDVRRSLEPLAGTYRGERGVRAFSAIDRALAALDRNAGVKVVADWLVLQL